MSTYSLSPWFSFSFLSVCLSVAIMLKDDYFVRGAGLPGRFKAEKVEFHWGPSNGSEGSEHSINGHRYPVEVRTVYQVFTSHQVSLIWEKVVTFLKRCKLWCGWDGNLVSTGKRKYLFELLALCFKKRHQLSMKSNTPQSYPFLYSASFLKSFPTFC